MPGSGNWESLWASLTRSRTILPSRYRAFNPEMQSLWPVLVVGVVASLVVLAMLFYNILNFDPNRPTLSLLKLNPIQAIHASGTRPAQHLPAPEFEEGVTVQIRRSGAIFAGPGINPLPTSPDMESRRGVVQDGLWQQGRWLYQVRLSPTQVVWVAESDLIRMQP
jgi:hypothetical protein